MTRLRIPFLWLLQMSTVAAFAPPIVHSRTTSTTGLAVAFSPDYLMFQNSRDPLPRVQAAAAVTEQPLVETNNNEQPPPTLLNTPGPDGVYHLENQAEHAALLAKFPNHLIVLKCFAPWCRACKALAPKFSHIATTTDGVVFCDISVQNNKPFIKSLGILALPTVQLYVAGRLHDSFPCGPSKVPILQRKLKAVLQTHLDPVTRLVKEEYLVEKDEKIEEESIGTTSDRVLTVAERNQLAQSVPYLRELSLADLDAVLDKAVLRTYPPSTVLMREGEPGRTFYWIVSGAVEILQEVGTTHDPLIALAPDYLGSVINRLEAGDFFGERALITGEPRAASIRAAEDESVQVWTLDATDFPASSQLSGKTRLTSEDAVDVNEKYGVKLRDLEEDVVPRAIQAKTSQASQRRGSVNNPQKIKGVDYDVDSEEEESEEEWIRRDLEETDVSMPTTVRMDNESIFSTLTRFHMIRRVQACLEYIQENRVVWGDAGNLRRRSMLVSRLSSSRQGELKETFAFMDINHDGSLEVGELEEVLETIQGVSNVDNSRKGLLKDLPHGGTISYDDFMGLMAEAEFFYLFRDVFSSLDKNESGFVKAGDLDAVLCGVRDLISDDRKSLIDVEDKDMHIDYEQFTRMLLGTTLQ